MNIVIVGCGNIGFETAKRLCNGHKLLLINRSCPEDLAQFVRNHDNVWFESADATNPSSIEAVLTKCEETFETVDVLISTVGASCSTSALEDVERFESEFSVNFFGNLVPVQAILKRMPPGKTGRIIVISSTSGVFTYPGLTAYAPAKWALTNFCLNLRDKIKRHGISVDIVFPSSIRNRRSRTFLYENGIECEDVAAEIVRILKGKHNSNRFVPKRYALLHTLERLFPRVLDRKAGLNSKRKKLFRTHKADSVLITGACSELGKELAMNYAKTAKKLYLLGSDEKALSELKGRIKHSSDCVVDEVCLDLTDFRGIASLAGRIENVELIISNTDFSVSELVGDVTVSDYESSFKNGLFGTICLITEFMRKKVPPVKIVQVIPVATAEDRSRFGCYSAGRAALWAFTRSLRRTFGNRIQVMEVILGKQHEVRCGADTVVEEVDDVNYENDRQSCTVSPRIPLAAQTLAQSIHELEIKGKEVVVLPMRYKLSMCLGAIMPWRLG
jgi:NAD(P)-dependent dehydrogenase (short-subunit alcohol dehydrogenase family)